MVLRINVLKLALEIKKKEKLTLTHNHNMPFIDDTLLRGIDQLKIY